MAEDPEPSPAFRNPFTTMNGAAEYLAAYDAVLAQWPVPVESARLRSPYGTTHVNVCGPREGPPLVLLHGGGATSTVWFGQVELLSRTRRVYAVDTIGEAGRSVADGRPVTTQADLMDWLDGLFNGLDLDAADLCGHSYGGWLALGYALHAPKRVRRLTLLDPTDCFAGLRLSYRLRSVPLFVRPDADRMRAFIHWETGGAAVDPAWLRLMCLGAEFPRSKVVMPRRPASERLRASDVPALVLLAGRSRAHDVREVAAGARRLLPHVVTEVLPGVSHHGVPSEDPGPLGRALEEFLG
ncbi:alpha/beta fold hydrolase [Planotetraspora kaengkrachanensis]|uniref:Carboxylesterase n=1 Tax=Planotetraspora kaengkrachanensis TaxID=575193 RepID=A0A8J3LXR8_9ACTN|nr:alpha/beta hydrolase [Planotetraspora kaengkrachanensis]GIG80497.1 carboxylesterase [Planotetraspora kaengkrachanensis]